MSGGAWWPWLGLVFLGALHGVNPGMGWLFAAALGMQEGRSSAAWGALAPLALGHAMAVAVLLGVMLGFGLAVPPEVLRTGVGVLLVGFGALRWTRRSHPRLGGMRAGLRDLVAWSFLMASAHGAGLMVLPFFLGGVGHEGSPGHGPGAHGMATGAHGMSAGTPDGIELALAGSPPYLEAAVAVVVHTGAYILVTGAIAVLVVRWLGLRLLRTVWIDLDRLWAGALLLTGTLTLVL